MAVSYIVQWTTDKGNTHKGKVIFESFSHYKVEHLETGEILEIPRICCRFSELREEGFDKEKDDPDNDLADYYN